MSPTTSAWPNTNQLAHYRWVLALILVVNIVSFLTVEVRIAHVPGVVELFALSTGASLICMVASLWVPKRVDCERYDRMMSLQLCILVVYFGFQTAVTQVNTMETVDMVLLSLVAPFVMPRRWMLWSWMALNPLLAFASVMNLTAPQMSTLDYVSLVGFGTAIGVVVRIRLLRAQAERDRATAVLEAVFRRSRDGLMVLDPKGAEARYLNPRMFELFGNPDPKVLANGIIKQIGAADVIDLDTRLSISDHKALQARVSSVRLQTVDRSVRLVQVTDVSDLYDRQRRLREEKRSAEAAVEVRSRFLANMSHEIRTPMNGVIGMASLLHATPLNAEQQELVGTIETSGETLLAIINDILDFSKIEADQIQLELRPVSIEQGIQDALSMVRVQAESKGLALRFDLQVQDLSAYLADSVRLRQVLLNLLSNAIKFTALGSVTVSLSRAKNGAIEIAVADSGIGIETAQLDQLFEPFTQADASTNRRFGGTGLGLSISRALIELMGGRLWAESELGQGSTFSIQLPLEPCDETMQPQARSSVSIESSELAWPADLRVLVAEDNAVNRAVAIKSFARLGVPCDVAENGKRALARVQQQDYAVIFMDMQMPEMDGLEATRQLRTLGRSTRVVAMTANAMAEDRERCLAAGMDDFLSKPVRLGDLQESLTEVLAELKR